MGCLCSQKEEWPWEQLSGAQNIRVVGAAESSEEGVASGTTKWCSGSCSTGVSWWGEAHVVIQMQIKTRPLHLSSYQLAPLLYMSVLITCKVCSIAFYLPHWRCTIPFTQWLLTACLSRRSRLLLWSFLWATRLANMFLTECSWMHFVRSMVQQP